MFSEFLLSNVSEGDMIQVKSTIIISYKYSKN